MRAFTQLQAWVVEMPKGTPEFEVQPEEPLGEGGAKLPGEPGEIIWDNTRPRAVTRLATHVFGDPPTWALNTPRYFGDYTSVVPKTGPRSQAMDYDPDGYEVYRFRYNPITDYTRADVHGLPVMASGVPCTYDGDRLSEYGFHYYPWFTGFDAYDDPEILSGGLAGLSLQFTAIYEWHDHRGRVHRSPPAPPIVHTFDPEELTDAADLRVATLQLTEHHDIQNENTLVEIVLFCTTDGGSQFHRIQSALNDVSAPYVEFTVTLPPTGEEEILYTDGGVLVDFQPPALSQLTHWDSRIWGISCDDPTMLWVSKIIQPGWMVPGFPLSFVIQSDAGGKFVALAPLGSQLLALKEDGVFAYAGNGPNDLGSQGTLSGPHTLLKHTGCVNPKSVVVTPQGVAFQSRESFWMIDRSHQASRIGAPVEDWLAQYPQCRASVLDQRRELIYFFMTSDTYAGWTEHEGDAKHVMFGEAQEGYWLELDGTGYADIGNVVPLDFEYTDTFTICAWVDNTDPAGFDMVFCKQAAGAAGYYLVKSNLARYQLYLQSSSGETLYAYIPEPTVSPAHVSVSYDGSGLASGISFYVDGVATTATGVGSITGGTIVNAVSATIGSRGAGSLWTGNIGPVAVFSSALTPTEINDIYERAEYPLGTLEGLWYPTDPIEDPTLLDHGPHTLDANMVGGAGIQIVPNGGFPRTPNADWVDQPLDFERTDDFTLAAWFRNDPTNLGVQHILTKTDPRYAPSGWAIAKNYTNSALYFTLGDFRESHVVIISPTVSPIDNEWHLVTWRHSAANTFLWLDGTGYAEIGNVPELDFGPCDEFTACGWVYANSGALMRIVGKREDAPQVGWGLSYQATGGFGLFRGTADGGFCNVVTDAGVAPTSTPVFVCSVVRGHRAADVEIYVNGVRTVITATGDTLGEGSSMAGASSARIGANFTGVLPFDGGIDDVAVYNRALTPAEVAEVYANRNALDTLASFADCVGYWPVRDTDGATIADVSASANDATLAGGANVARSESKVTLDGVDQPVTVALNTLFTTPTVNEFPVVSGMLQPSLISTDDRDPWDGQIGAIGGWRRCLTDDEVASLWAAGREADWSDTEPTLHTQPHRDQYPVIEDFGAGGTDGLMSDECYGEDLVRERIQDGGTVLCYHYLLNEWTIWRFDEEVKGADICWREDLGRHELTTVQGDDVVYLSDSPKEHDGSYLTMTVATPWLQWSGLAGFQRVRACHIRGKYLGPHSLRVRFYYDNNDLDFDEYNLTEADVSGMVRGVEEHVRFPHLPRQKCKALKVEIVVTPTGDGATVRLETVAFEVAGKKGLFKLPLEATR